MDRTEQILRNIKPEDLDLGGLTMPPFDKEAAWERVQESEKETEEYIKKVWG